MLIPGWDSLDSVRHAHSELEAAALAFFALLVLFDVLAHLSKDEERKTLLEKIGLGFFAVAVLAEMVAYPYGQRNDTLSAQVIGSLDAKSSEAYRNASSALTKSGEAETKAAAADTVSGKAVAESSSAMSIANGARSEADTFEADIKSAKEQATKAESHLEEATKSANILTAKLERLTTPRRLLRSDPVVAPLRAFERTQYVFIGTCADHECFDLLTDIDALLKLAGWQRIKGPVMRIGITQVHINGDKDFAVDISLSTGTVISAQTPGGIESLNGLPDVILPGYVRAAVALNEVLAAHIAPSENTGMRVGIKSGASTAVEIDVGRKPM